MTSISANLVKDLREKTSAAIMDCKKALIETNGDFEAAVDWLRTKGLSAAAKKSSRIAAEGLVAIAVSGKVGTAVEVNSETDFVALNEKFQALVSEISALSLNAHNIDELKQLKMSSGNSVVDGIVDAVATIGENISLRRSARLEVQDGVVSHYVHNAVSGNLGKIAVLVALESTGDKEKLAALGKQIAMHVAAAKPVSLDTTGVDAVLLEREKQIFAEQSRASGKPESIIDKMVEGRIRKFYEEIVLLEQIFVIDGKTKIADLVSAASKDVGAEVKLTNFVRFELGDGIEQENKDFAAEVAAITNK
jgi:elongation factor Ts